LDVLGLNELLGVLERIRDVALGTSEDFVAQFRGATKRQALGASLRLTGRVEIG
jgi:hypothetical protein